MFSLMYNVNEKKKVKQWRYHGNYKQRIICSLHDSRLSSSSRRNIRLVMRSEERRLYAVYGLAKGERGI